MPGILGDFTFPGTATTATTAAGANISPFDTASVGTAGLFVDNLGNNWYRDGSGNARLTTLAADTNWLSHRDTIQDVGVKLYCKSLDAMAAAVSSSAVCSYRASTMARVGAYSGSAATRYECWITHQYTKGAAGQTYVPTVQFVLNSGAFVGSWGNVGSAGVNFDSSHRYAHHFKCVGVSPTTLTLEVYDLDGGSPTVPVYTFSHTDSTAGYQTAGTWAVGGATSGTGMTFLADRVSYDDTTNTVTPGTLSATNTSPTAIALAVTAATAGTSPYTYQLQRSPTGAGTYSNVGAALTGQTSSATFTDSTVVASTTYDYRVAVTDSATASANSNVVTATASYAAITPGALSLASSGLTTLGLSWAASAGGSGTFAYQLWRSQTSGFAPGDVGSSQVYSGAGLSFTDTPGGGPNSVYYYAAKTVDATAGLNATGNQIGGALWRQSGFVGYIGDSITANGYPAVQSSLTLADYGLVGVGDAGGNILSNTNTAGLNAGSGGSDTNSWVQLDTVLPGSGITPRQTIAYLIANGAKYVSVMLGTNDAKTAVLRSAATYAANLTTLCTYLLSQGILKVTLHAPPYINLQAPIPGGAWSAASLPALQSYAAILPSVCNGATVFLGNTQAFPWSCSGAATLFTADGVHGTQAFEQQLGNQMGVANAAMLGFTPSGSGGGYSRSRLVGGA